MYKYTSHSGLLSFMFKDGAIYDIQAEKWENINNKA